MHTTILLHTQHNNTPPITDYKDHYAYHSQVALIDYSTSLPHSNHPSIRLTGLTGLTGLTHSTRVTHETLCQRTNKCSIVCLSLEGRAGARSYSNAWGAKGKISSIQNVNGAKKNYENLLNIFSSDFNNKYASA